MGAGAYGRDISIVKNLVNLAAGVPSGTIVISQTPNLCRGLWVETAGKIDVVMQGSTVITGVPFIAGINPGAFKELRGSSNTASNVFAIY